MKGGESTAFQEQALTLLRAGGIVSVLRGREPVVQAAKLVQRLTVQAQRFDDQHLELASVDPKAARNAYRKARTSAAFAAALRWGPEGADEAIYEACRAVDKPDRLLLKLHRIVHPQFTPAQIYFGSMAAAVAGAFIVAFLLRLVLPEATVARYGQLTAAMGGTFLVGALLNNAMSTQCRSSSIALLYCGQILFSVPGLAFGYATLPGLIPGITRNLWVEAPVLLALCYWATFPDIRIFGCGLRFKG